MKALKLKNLSYLVAALLFIVPMSLLAQQTKGNKKVIKQERTISAFSSLQVGGAFNVYFTQKDETSLFIEADENLMDKIETEVSGETLKISSRNIRNATSLNIYLTGPALNNIDISGAATLLTKNTLSGESLSIEASGASEADLQVDVETLKTRASGASEVKISGNAGQHTVVASGAADVKASKLITNSSDANASGASHVSINASEKVTTSSSGAGNISVSGNPEIYSNEQRKSTYSSGDNTKVESWRDGDVTTVKVGGIVVEVTDGDSTKVAIGNHSLVVDEDGNVEWKRNKVNKFKGHWAGLDLGVNGYVDKDFDINMPKGYEFLTLKYEKSIDVNINFFEQNINLINNKLGLVTGLGLRWNNYRFSNNTILNPDSVPIYGYRDNDNTRDWRKSKLVVNYLTLPLMLEYQTNRFSRSNSFHISAGVLLGWRYSTHTKMLYFENGRQKPKQFDSFNINPFRYDATVRVGWGVINLYATYSMNTLFKDGGGPELYPFAIGITFMNL